MSAPTPEQHLRGLYLITDHQLTEKSGLVAAVAAAIQGGARLVQYRNKHATQARKRWEIEDLLTLCRPLGIPLIVNDDIALAAETGADGVHLGTEDGDISAARTRLGTAAIIGASCYNSLDRARTAAAEGASYVAFGRFFPSQTKPDAVLATPDLLQAARAELKIPLCAIGGIDATNGTELITAGADMLAVVHAVLAADDITAAAGTLNNLFH